MKKLRSTVCEFATSIVPSVVLPLTAISCGAGISQPGTFADHVSGTYSVTWTRSAASCAPQALPRPIDSDTTVYAALPEAQSTVQISLIVNANDGAVSMTGKSAQGTAVPALELSGILPATNESVFVSRSTTQLEGPRTGGHTFTVRETGADSALFLGFVETPPGRRIEVTLSARGVGSLEFRDGGPTGPLFTTCQYTEQLAGSKLPNG